MEIIERTLEDAIVFDMRGRFEFRVSGEFKRAVEKVEQSHFRHLILNLSDVSYLDSAALALLHYAHQKLAWVGGKISILNPQPHAEKLLAMANIPSIISIHCIEEEALLIG